MFQIRSIIFQFKNENLLQFESRISQVSQSKSISSVPPELRSVNRHDEKEPLDKDLEDPCQKLDPFMGCLNSQKLRKRFETHIEKTDYLYATSYEEIQA